MLTRYSSRGFAVVLAALIFVAAHGVKASQPADVVPDTMGTLVTTEWLSKHLDDPDLVVLDCTVLMIPKEGGGFQSLSGRGDFDRGHIPSAGFADFLDSLSNTDSKMGFAMPTPEEFCAAMGALGVGDDSRVVLYDGFQSVWAARVWWMLRWVGFDRAAVLDGGIKAWTAEERPLSTAAANRQAKKLTPKPRPELIAHRKEVFAAIKDKSISLIDAMFEPHYRGELTFYDRPGHIPGAVNIPSSALLDESGCYRPDDELAAMFDKDRKARVITYCGAGIAASSNAFVLHRIGYTNVAVYVASLQEWAADPANPLVVDKP